jgi:DNA repair exonuclease SbcCD ATPase subunit
MAEDGKGTPQNPDGGNTPPKEGDNMVPSYRLKEEADKRRELETRLAEIEKQERERKAKELEEQGKYKELLKERDQELERVKQEAERYKGIAGKWQGYEQEKKNALLERIPEDRREKFANLGLQELEAIVEMVSHEPPKDPTNPSGVQRPQGMFDGYATLTEFAEAMFRKGSEGKKRYDEVVSELQAQGKL